MFSSTQQVDELRGKLEEKNKMIEKKTQAALTATQDKNRVSNELSELRDQVRKKLDYKKHMLKKRRISQKKCQLAIRVIKVRSETIRGNNKLNFKFKQRSC